MTLEGLGVDVADPGRLFSVASDLAHFDLESPMTLIVRLSESTTWNDARNAEKSDTSPKYWLADQIDQSLLTDEPQLTSLALPLRRNHVFSSSSSRPETSEKGRFLQTARALLSADLGTLPTNEIFSLPRHADCEVSVHISVYELYFPLPDSLGDGRGPTEALDSGISCPEAEQVFLVHEMILLAPIFLPLILHARHQSYLRDLTFLATELPARQLDDPLNRNVAGHPPSPCLESYINLSSVVTDYFVRLPRLGVAVCHPHGLLPIKKADCSTAHQSMYALGVAYTFLIDSFNVTLTKSRKQAQSTCYQIPWRGPLAIPSWLCAPPGLVETRLVGSALTVPNGELGRSSPTSSKAASRYVRLAFSLSFFVSVFAVFSSEEGRDDGKRGERMSEVLEHYVDSDISVLALVNERASMECSKKRTRARHSDGKARLCSATILSGLSIENLFGPVALRTKAPYWEQYSVIDRRAERHGLGHPLAQAHAPCALYTFFIFFFVVHPYIVGSSSITWPQS
ncbi:hypothetical protein SODALDRAFT_356506 [Sodiomyces alkalinus F11]|uniref:Uncharacterized protein n=1 Tax=Sodiomyces alkalinus (strain CBS 110278 / VKM F-3762 / F11) TaxID=1314773 RepID=A0A3N2Q1D8_SODAK|nr:hypothetical protein SODALDRAFT_356506 [Sodiomyces alkalinus F11]ROT40508.1 hypothetical protein SODALDRAFT_356506 [Sodiomyces alkalinus F11]